MNVTLKLPDDLVREARHRAVNRSKSLSAWMADLVRRELNAPTTDSEKPASWIDAFSGDADDSFLKQDFAVADRKAVTNRKFSFDPNDA